MAGVEFFSDVFEPEYCSWLARDARSALSEGNKFGRSNFHWPSEVVGSSQPVFVRDYDEFTARFILGKLNERGIAEGFDYIVMNYAWCRLSFIPWHNDGHVGTAITIFLNETWDADWGGLFLYRLSPEGKIFAKVPSFNTGIRNEKNVYHATSLVALDAPEPRFTIQVFSK